MENWIDILLDHDFEIVHRPGILNILPDTLSRLFPETGFKLEPSKPHGPPQSLHSMERPISQMSQDERSKAIETAHIQGHFGQKVTLARLIADGRTWPSMRRDVEEYLKTCQACQRFNIVKHGYHPLSPITAAFPMDHIAIDTALSFPTSATGKNVLLVIMCVHSRFCWLRALPDKTATSVASSLFSIFCDFGFPKIIQSDNGTEFVNQLVQLMTKNCGIDHRLTTPYHPRANGLAERNVQTSCRAIKKLLEGENKQWDRFVPAVQLFMNTKVSAAHDSAPFSVMFGRRINNFQDFSDIDPANADFAAARAKLHWFTDVLFPAIADKEAGNASKAITAFARSNRISKDPFPPGSFVMVINPTKSSKAEPSYEGPFKVLRKTRGGSYQLLDNDASLFSRAVAPSQMKLVSKNPKHDAVSFVVDRILAHRGKPAAREYLVRWKGGVPEDDSWEPFSSFNDQQIIAQYWSGISKPLSHSEGSDVMPSHAGDMTDSARSVRPRRR